MAKIRVYIVEDEPLIAATIESSLIKEGFEVVGHADNIGDAFFEIDDVKPDLVFLDITMDGKQRGIELGRKLNSKTNIPFIYLTSHSDKKTVEEAGATNPSGYLLKPFKSKDLKVAVDFALSKLDQKETANVEDFMFVKSNKKWTKLQMNDILFAKADDTYTELHTLTGRTLISQTLKRVEEKLDPRKFKRVHRSYIVNISAINAIEDDILIVDKELIPIGKTYKTELLSQLNFL